MINTIVLCLSIFLVAISVLFGLWRGLSKSVLRFILVAVSVLVAWLLKGVFVNLLSSIKINGQTFESLAISAVAGSVAPSENLVLIVSALIRMLINVVSFTGVFLITLILTYAILYPIGRMLFFRKGFGKRRRLFGALIGLVQGCIVAFVFMFPISGVIAQYNRIADIELDATHATLRQFERQLDGKIGNLGLKDYEKKFPNSIYCNWGKGLFNKLTTTDLSYTDANGNEIKLQLSLETAASTSIAVLGINKEVEVIKEVFNNSSSSTELKRSNGETVDTSEMSESMVQATKLEILSESLKNIDEKITDDSVKGDDAQQFIGVVVKEVVKLANDIAKDSSGQGSSSPDTISLGENFDISQVDLGSLATAVDIIGTNIKENEQSNEPVALGEDNVQAIVDGLALNEVMVDAIQVDALVDENAISAEDKALFNEKLTQAVAEETISPEFKAKLEKLLALNK